MYLKLLPLAMAIFAVGTTTSIPVGIIPILARDLDVSPGAAGQVTSAFALVFALSAPIMTTVLSPLPRRTALVIALTIFTAGNVGVALSHDYWMVLAFRALTGLGAGVINATALSAGSDIAGPERRGKALGFIMSALALATALGVPIGTFVAGIDWHLAFWGVAVVGAVGAIGSWISVKIPAYPPMRLVDRFRPLTHPWALRVVLVTLCITTGGQIFYNYFGVAAGGVTNHDQGLLSLILLIAGPFSVLSMSVAGAMTDRFPHFTMLLVGISCMAIMQLLSPIGLTALPLTIAWLCLHAFFGGFPILPQQQRMLGWSPTLGPVLIGLNSAAIYGGVALGSMIGGLLQTWIPVTMLGIPAAGSYILAIIIALTTRKTPPPPDAPGAPPAEEHLDDEAEALQAFVEEIRLDGSDLEPQSDAIDPASRD